MTLIETLTKLGLDEKAARIYLAALELGPSSVQAFAARAGVKRPTAYLVLDELRGMGLIVKTTQKRRQLFVAENPDALLQSLKNKEKLLAEALPELAAIVATTKTRPKVTIYEGEEGIRRLYFGEMLNAPEIWWFGSVSDIDKRFHDVVVEATKLAKLRKIKGRDILVDSPEDLAYARSVVSDTYEVRIMPKGIAVQIDCSIFGNKIAVIAVKKDLVAVVIESQEVADSFRTIHRLAWEGARPLAEVTAQS